MNSLRRLAASEFSRNGALVFCAILGGNCLNYLFYMQLGRVLSVRDYGAVMSLIFGMLLVFGIGSVMQTIVAKLAADIRATNDLDRVSALCRAAWRFAIWLGVGAILVIFALSNLIANYLHIDNVWLVRVVGVTTGVGFIVLLQRGMLQGLGNFSGFGISSMLDGLQALLITPLTLWLGAVGSLLAMLLALVISATYGSTILARSSGKQGPIVRFDVRRMMTTAAKTGSPTLAITILMCYDVVLARHFLSPNDAGLYGAAALVGRVLFAVIAFLPIVLLPHVAHRSVQGRSQSHLLLLALAGAIVLIGGIALVSGASPFLVIYILAGKKFLTAAPIVLPYVVASGALALANILSVYAIACHRFRFVPYLVVLGFGEVALVSIRHASSMEIATDILAGHMGVLCVTGIATVLDFARSRPQIIASVA